MENYSTPASTMVSDAGVSGSVTEGANARLYRYDPNGSYTYYKRTDDIQWAGGVQTRTPFIWLIRPQNYLCLCFDPESGSISNRRVFIDLNAESFYPDGLTVDRRLYLVSYGTAVLPVWPRRQRDDASDDAVVRPDFLHSLAMKIWRLLHYDSVSGFERGRNSKQLLLWRLEPSTKAPWFAQSSIFLGDESNFRSESHITAKIAINSSILFFRPSNSSFFIIAQAIRTFSSFNFSQRCFINWEDLKFKNWTYIFGIDK